MSYAPALYAISGSCQAIRVEGWHDHLASPGARRNDRLVVVTETVPS